MNHRFFTSCLLLGAVLCLAGVVACDGRHSPVAPAEPGSAGTDFGAAGRPTQAPKLNLSHIECVDGAVEIHFVLLFVPDGVTPGTLTYTYGTIEPGKNTGNVWHYTDSGLSDGFYDVTSASVGLSNGAVVSLHNPGDYSGDYDCAGSACALPAAEPLLCFVPSSLGSETAECALFGLVALGKDDGLTGSSHVAGMSAALAIVKNGRGPCDPGENAYRTYTNVQAGDVLAQPAGAGDISHVTYCGCPV